ncbi:unnamed protein product [Periconia digitata]|uniref:Transmembrane protein n=1 Tax=Periconia digitata TaxID=1303443 RepID=A0A9W4U865_9PLEO|nr:unnamed protein product [Periconia digitata]
MVEDSDEPPRWRRGVIIPFLSIVGVAAVCGLFVLVHKLTRKQERSRARSQDDSILPLHNALALRLSPDQPSASAPSQQIALRRFQGHPQLWIATGHQGRHRRVTTAELRGFVARGPEPLHVQQGRWFGQQGRLVTWRYDRLPPLVHTGHGPDAALRYPRVRNEHSSDDTLPQYEEVAGVDDVDPPEYTEDDALEHQIPIGPTSNFSRPRFVAEHPTAPPDYDAHRR